MKQAHLHHSEDLVLYYWAQQGKCLYAAFEPLNSVQIIRHMAAFWKLQPHTASPLTAYVMISAVQNTREL